MNITKIKAEVATAENILRQLRQTHDIDDDMVSIVIEGETNLASVIDQAINRRNDLHSMIKAIDDRSNDLEARRYRYKMALIAIDSALLLALEATGQRKIETAESTIFLQASPPSVVITDETKIPAQWMRTKDPEPNKIEIKKALIKGDRIPGAELSNQFQTIRIKSR